MAMSVYNLSKRRLKKAVKVVVEGKDDWGKPVHVVTGNFNSRYGDLKVRCHRAYPGVWFDIEVNNTDYMANKYLSYEADEMKNMKSVKLISLWTDKEFSIPANVVRYFILAADRV